MSCSNANHPARRPVNASDLPIEVLNLILQHCEVSDINTEITFKLLCRKFYHTAGSLRLLRRVVHSDSNLKFERICMDDESESQGTGRRVCRVCKQRHPAGYFSDEELEKKAMERVCKSGQRRLRLTPGDSFSYTTLMSFLPEYYFGSDLALGSPYNEDFKFRTPFDEQRYCVVTMDWDLILDSGFSEQSLRCQLTKFPVCVCPHSRSDSEAFADAVVRYQKNRAQNPSHTDCSVCGSRVDFGVQQIGHDKKEGGEKTPVNFPRREYLDIWESRLWVLSG